MAKYKKILVTGADGFIGSHLTEALVRAGYDVRAMVYYNSFGSWGWLDTLPPKVKKSFEVVLGDIRDPQGVKRIVEDRDAVLHLAALIAIPYSYTSPDSYVDTNIKGTLNILQACRSSNVSKLVHTSTSEVYGTAEFVPITEKHPLKGQSPYSASKIGADQLALSFFYSFALPVGILRPFNTYGPRQSTRAVIPAIISQITAKQKQIKLGALHPTRDFTYVKDTVRGFVAALESERSVGEVINIGTNSEISIADTAKLISELMNKPVRIVGDSQRLRPKNSEVERLRADNSKASSLLGWAPQYGGRNGFIKGLKETIEWFSCKENLARYKTGLWHL